MRGAKWDKAGERKGWGTPMSAHPTKPSRLPAFLLIRSRELLFRSRGGGVARVFAAEAIDAALRVHEAVLARVERVAGSTDIDLELVASGAGLELIATGAAHANDLVLGVDAVFHFRFFLPHAKKRWGA